MVLESGQAQLRKAGRSLAIEAKAGQILFPGDVLESGGKAVTLQYCPGESIYRLSPRSELRVGVQELNVLDGKLDSIRELPVCILPELPASVPATRRHNGASLVRDLLDDGQPPADLAGQPRGIGEVSAGSFENEMAPVEAALRADPEDLPARIAKAVLLGRHGLSTEAATEYRQLHEILPDSTWLRERLFVHEERAAQRSLLQQRNKTTMALEGQGQTFALLIGISQYQDPRIKDLQFAHTDALLFEKHLKSPRGGALPDENIKILVNEEANTSAVRNAFDSFLKAQAGPNDIVLVFLAAHGTVDRKTGEGYIVTYDSNPEDLASTAVLMSDIQNLIQEELRDIRRLLIYVDVCHAGMIGTIDTHRNRIHRHVANLAQADGEVGGMMASRPGEVSFEGPQYGGGHGAFSYFLLNALNGAADYDQDGVVSVDDVIDYVRNHVEEGTFNRQHPRDIGDLPNDLPMARLEDEGIEVQPWRKPQPGKRRQTMTQLGGRTRGFVAPAIPPRSRRRDDLTSDQQRFDEALEQGRILPSDPDNAFSSLNDLRRPSGKWQNKVGRDVLFIQRNLDFLKPGGRMAIVLPQGRMNNTTDKIIRGFIADHARILSVVGLYGNTFKPHAGTKTSILFCQKWNDDPKAPPRLRCPKVDDYPIFFAVSQQGGKDTSGEYIYLTDDKSRRLYDLHAHPIVDHDLFNLRAYLADQLGQRLAVANTAARKQAIRDAHDAKLPFVPDRPDDHLLWRCRDVPDRSRWRLGLLSIQRFGGGRGGGASGERQYPCPLCRGIRPGWGSDCKPVSQSERSRGSHTDLFRSAHGSPNGME